MRVGFDDANLFRENVTARAKGAKILTATRKDEEARISRRSGLGENCRSEEYLRKYELGCWKRRRDELNARLIERD